jgi:hypothetical protein
MKFDFLSLLQLLTPLLGPILQVALPKINPAAIPHIVAGVATAEQLAVPGVDKKTIATTIAAQGLEATAAAGVPIPNVDAIAQDIPAAVQLTVDLVNAIAKHPAVPQPPKP